MSHVYLLTQTDYKHYEDYEKEENRDVSVLYVWTTAKAANDAAKEWVEEYFSDGDNEMKQDENGCDTWTCRLERDDQSHVLIAVVMKPLFDEPEVSEIDGEEQEEGESNSKESTPASGPKEAQEPPAKRARQA